MKRIYSKHWPDYELIDAGDNKKLERWGTIITIRPDRNAYFKPVLSINEWNQRAHYEFIELSANAGAWGSLKKEFPVSNNHEMLQIGKLLLMNVCIQLTPNKVQAPWHIP